jgi:hypothetical protein
MRENSTFSTPAATPGGHERQTFIITLRGPAGVEAIRALRGLLKIDSRRYGLVCVAVPELPRDPIEPEPSAQHDVEDIHAHTTEHGQNAQPRGASAVTRARWRETRRVRRSMKSAPR